MNSRNSFFDRKSLIDRAYADQSGVYVIFVMISFVALAMFVGLAVDVGRAYVQQANLERTIDSASLVAASKYMPGQVTTALSFLLHPRLIRPLAMPF